jgi:hypothetical protein
MEKSEFSLCEKTFATMTQPRQSYIEELNCHVLSLQLLFDPSDEDEVISR